jgi:2-polyprenyl-3-methyl-5-hydroxy-6-metoxy-1,4-benzoquinol methylase
MTAGGLDVRDYWERRLGEHDGLGGVGWLGLGESFNRWMYAVRRRVFVRAVREVAGPVDGRRVLDVGSGTGFYLDLWRRLGVRSLTGSDLTEVAVERLRARLGGVEVVRLDVTAEDLPLPDGSFDVVSAMDVLFHVVDEDAYRRALRNVARLLAPGGLFFVSENLVSERSAHAVHQTSRSRADVERLLGDAGLEPVDLRPMFYLMNTPVDTSSPALRLWWRGLSRAAAVHDRAGWALGAAVYPVELALTRAGRRGPSTKLIACRRR